MQEVLVIQVNYASTINTHWRFAKDDLRRHDVWIYQFLSIFALNLSHLLYLPLFLLLFRSPETPLQRIEPQRWLTFTPTSPSMRNRTSGSELFRSFSFLWIPEIVSLPPSEWPSHLHRPLDASCTCCVLSSTHSRMEPNYRSSTENIPFHRTTWNTQCTTTSYVCSLFLCTRSKRTVHLFSCYHEPPIYFWHVFFILFTTQVCSASQVRCWRWTQRSVCP